jgi:hypothetical protein
MLEALADSLPGLGTPIAKARIARFCGQDRDNASEQVKWRRL